MKKFIVYLLFVLGFLAVSAPVLAVVTIPNYLGVNNFGELLLRIAEGIGTIITALGTIMIIWSAVLFLTSAGSAEKMTKAKTALIYAMIGIIVGISASTIVNIIRTIIGASS